jgi:hypothetical protein
MLLQSPEQKTLHKTTESIEDDSAEEEDAEEQ